MMCPECGAGAAADTQRCPRCGAAFIITTGAMPFELSVSGVPVQRFAPTAFGALASAPPRPTALVQMPPEGSSQRAGGYRPIVLPPPPPKPRRRRSGWRGFVALLAVLLLATVGGVALARSSATPLRVGPFQLVPALASQPSGAQASGTPPAATCSPQSLTSIPASPPADITQAQLTTALRDAAARDYRPVDTVSSFASGHSGYVTFQIASSARGTVRALFCVVGASYTGSVTVPAGSSGRYGEFAVPLAHARPGNASLLLTWNGIPEQRLDFSIVR